MSNQPISITDVLDNPEGRRLVELIEELISETEPALVEIRDRYINELYDKFGYKYVPDNTENLTCNDERPQVCEKCGAFSRIAPQFGYCLRAMTEVLPNSTCTYGPFVDEKTFAQIIVKCEQENDQKESES